MSAECTIKSTCVCKKKVYPNRKIQKSSYFIGLLLAILPKCPFCAFGYSAVLTLCSGKSIHTYIPNYLHWLPIALAILLVVSLIWNFKGRFSYYALWLAVIGTAFVAYAELQTGNETIYYIGVVLLFGSILLNGRLQRVWQRVKTKSMI
jgi:hypothetical protein